jgi:KipI family sensor histidine kinase inhibitor
MEPPSFTPVAGHGLLVELAPEMSEAASRAVVQLDKAILAADIPGVLELTPALINLLVIFDPLVTDHMAVEQAIRALLPLPDGGARKAITHNVPVCYEDGLTPDLDAVAQACGLSREAVINAHLGARYRVGMYGFAPGYAYLAGVAEAIQVPRKNTPVRDIPAGSVMIAGPQCLITTLKMPTGWSIIGRSPTQVMTDDPDKPFLFDVGDHVRFHRITRAEYDGAAP